MVIEKELDALTIDEVEKYIKERQSGMATRVVYRRNAEKEMRQYTDIELLKLYRLYSKTDIFDCSDVRCEICPFSKCSMVCYNSQFVHALMLIEILKRGLKPL